VPGLGFIKNQSEKETYNDYTDFVSRYQQKNTFQSLGWRNNVEQLKKRATFNQAG